MTGCMGCKILVISTGSPLWERQNNTAKSQD